MSGLGLGINLFNFVPISPLDGGRIAGALDKRIWWLGLTVPVWMLATSDFDIIDCIFSGLLVLFSIYNIYDYYKNGDSCYCLKCNSLNSVDKKFTGDTLQCSECGFDIIISKGCRWKIGAAYFGLIVVMLILLLLIW